MNRSSAWWLVACLTVLPWTGTARAEAENAHVAGIYNGMTGEITVTAVASDKVQVHFMLQAVGQPNTGEAEGTGVLKNGVATIVTTNGPPSCIMTLNFSGKGKLDVTQQGSMQDCGFGMNVTADGSYNRTKGPPKVAPTVAGAPTEAECKAKPPHGPPPSNQLAINEAEAAKATQEACHMRTAFLALDKSIAAKPGASDALQAAQQAWSAFLDAHELERFPHEDEQGYYGSILGMCIGGENQTMYKARTAELKSLKPCTEKAANAAEAESALQTSEGELRAAIAKLRASYSKDPKFMAAFARTEGAFDTLRRAQGAYAFAASGNNAACRAREVLRMNKQRIAQLNLWFDTKAAQDSCSGSYEGPPKSAPTAAPPPAAQAKAGPAATPAPAPIAPHLPHLKK